MGEQTTVKTLRERVNRLNEKLDRELELSSHSMGRRGRSYQLDDEDHNHINPRGATAKQMDYFLDGIFAGLRLAQVPTVRFETQGPDGEWTATKRSDEKIDLSDGVGRISSVGVPARIVTID